MSSMNQDPLAQELREKICRRPLTQAEQGQLDAWLAAHPEARADWAADAALNAALARLSEKPAPSNLTARVLAEIEREDLATAGARNTKTNFFGLGSWGWVTRTAVVVALLGLGVLGYQHHQHELAKAKAVQNIATAATAAVVTPLPSPEVLQDFDAIFLLPMMASGADTELIALLK